jgi:bifunctional UDP-N-acetylglucosamine pyrophosphorylase/glucosamine-1-phosphate N-acetyltransferase
MQEEAANDLRLEFVEQVAQRGTGDAVGVGLTSYADQDPDDDEVVLVLPGDTPLLRPATIESLVDHHRASGAAATVLTAEVDDPTGYGRVVRDRDGRVAHIVEQKDATAAQIEITEINTGIYCFRRNLLGPALRLLSPDNAQNEYYLTDVLTVLHDSGHLVGAVSLADSTEAHGVNDRLQLSLAEAELRRRTNASWLAAGVTMVDPAHTYIDTAVVLATDVTLFPNTILQGHTTIGPLCEIGPNARVVDSVIHAGAVVENSVVRNADVGQGARVGPYAVLEPGDTVAAGARTGAFYTPGAHG